MARYAKFFSVGAGGGGTNNLQLPVGTILDATLRQVQDGLGTGSPLYLSTRRVGITSDSSVTTQTSSVIQATTTNANLVIAPNGGGALISQIPDGTTAGGNARGNNSVDFSRGRIAANAVASGTNSGIFSGFSNRASGSSSNVGGGDYNAAIGGYAHIGGGINNTASSDFSTISGGQSNTASTNSHATVVGGQSNTASGQYSVAGGFSNTASGDSAVAFGRSNVVSGNNGSFSAGQQNTVSGNFSAAFGAANTVSGERNFAAGVSNAVSGTLGNAAFGNNNSVSSDLSSFAVGRQNQSFGYGFASGYRSVSIGYASRVLSNNAFATLASSQIREMIASREAVLTSAATAQLSLDGTGVTNLISTLYDVNRMWHVTLKYVAVVTSITGTATGVTVGDIKTQTIEIGVKRIVTVSSIVGAGNYSTPQQDASMTSASLIPSIVGSDLILTFTAPTFSGGGSVTCRVVAKVELTEVSYG